MTSSTYDGIRQTNAFYHSVIEDVTRSLQTNFLHGQEEEKKLLVVEFLVVEQTILPLPTHSVADPNTFQTFFVYLQHPNTVCQIFTTSCKIYDSV